MLTSAGATTVTVVAPAATALRSTDQPSASEQRRNVALLGLDMAIFAMGLGALGQLTIVPLFVSKLTDNPLAVGAVMAAIQIGWLPQIFIDGTIERSARKWPWVLLFGTLERVPATFLALIALASPHTGPWIVALVYLCCFSQTTFGGLGVAPWLDVIARVVPARLRGRFMGTSNTAGALLAAFALMGVVQSSSMMARLTGPMEYAPAERRPSYIALAFGTVGPCAALAPLLGGQIVAWFGYGALFVLSGAVALLALPFLGAGARAPARRAEAA
jgi:hypothetical protein